MKIKKWGLYFLFLILLTSCSISIVPTSSSSNSLTTSTPTTTLPISTITSSSLTSSFLSSSSKEEKTIKGIEWLEKPIVSSYVDEELRFSYYGKIQVAYSDLSSQEVALLKEHLKTNRIDIHSLDSQVAYINYEGFSLKFEIQLERKKASSSVEFVKKLKVGWNLGNAFSSYLDGFDAKNNRNIVEELGFSMDELEMFCEVRDQPQAYRGKITKATIQAVYEKGFRSIRIPIAWANHMDEKGTISERWISRIQEVVDYMYQDYNDIYIIITLMDGIRGYDLSNDHKEKTLGLVKNVWRQVAERFKNYDERLIFENLNEPLYNETIRWDMDPTQTKYQALYQEANENLVLYNQTFVDIVRENGSEKNLNRYLTVNTYGNIPEYVYDEKIQKVSKFTLPEDKVEDKILYNGHAYYPTHFCYHRNDDGFYKDSWSKDNPKDTTAIDQMLMGLYNTFVKKGIGVIISEWGTVDRSVDGRDTAREEHAYYYMKKASEKNIACFVWDNGAISGDEHEEAFGFLNKHKASNLYDNMIHKSYVQYKNTILWYHENILSSIFDGYHAGTAIL